MRSNRRGFAAWRSEHRIASGFLGYGLYMALALVWYLAAPVGARHLAVGPALGYTSFLVLRAAFAGINRVVDRRSASRHPLRHRQLDGQAATDSREPRTQRKG